MMLSAYEQRLLNFATDQFGEPLSRLLLTGLGEENESRHCILKVTFTDDKGVNRNREIVVEADDRPDLVPSLSRGREPLVMLALLRLLIVDRGLSSTSLSYEIEEVFGLLDWRYSPESQMVIARTIERYANLSYFWRLSAEELAERNLSFYEGESRFVSGYCHYTEEERGRSLLVSGSVDFNRVFIEELMQGTLFHVHWKSVR